MCFSYTILSKKYIYTNFHFRPATLIPQGGNRIQEASFQFILSPSQATNIASNRDIQMGSRLDYLYQVRTSINLL